MKLRDRMRLELAEVRQEVRNLTVMALDPSLPPEYRQLLKVLESLARTEAKLRRRALEYQLALEQHGEGNAEGLLAKKAQPPPATVEQNYGPLCFAGDSVDGLPNWLY